MSENRFMQIGNGTAAAAACRRENIDENQYQVTEKRIREHGGGGSGADSTLFLGTKRSRTMFYHYRVPVHVSNLIFCRFCRVEL